MQMKYEFLAPPNSSSPLRKLVTLIMTAVLAGLVLMFSAVLLVIIMIVGTVVWGYLWWKTRELRKRMRDFHARAMEREEMASNDAVFEGEVIRVVDPHNGK
jgi:O-antigen/teichoic acid export membrane protein